jgi:hypothetical protein
MSEDQVERQYVRDLHENDHKTFAALAALSDDDLTKHVANGPEYIAVPMEMNRRLLLALKGFKESSDTASRRLFWATVVLVVLTAAVVALTIVLIVTA